MGEKKSSRNHTTRKERKAKKRAVEDLIPDIPAPDLALSSLVNEEEKLPDKKENTSELHGNKRKRNRADDEDNDGKNKNEEKSNEKKKRKQSKKSSNKESKICEEVDNNCESVKRDSNKRDEEETKELPVKTKEKKKEKGKEDKTKQNPYTKDVIVDVEESSSVQGKESTSKRSKKEHKAESKGIAQKASDEGNDKILEATMDKNSKVATNTAEKETSKENDTITSTAINTVEKKTSKTKKDKKKKSQNQPGETTPTSKLDTSPSKTVVGKTSETLSLDKSSTNGTKSSTRFIVFVGNLPYTATKATIMSHFSKLRPVSVRHLTKKDDPSKSRGIAFVEFENYDTHKTALKIMHHSIFDDGQSEPRMINVELTCSLDLLIFANQRDSAGGGGNTEDRKAKIKSKNDRLNEQRIRRVEEEEKAKLKKEEEKARASKIPSSETIQSSSESNIHPSRRRMITA